MDEQQTPLPPGTPAPDFSLPRSAHASVSLGDFLGKRLVLAFYPADWEPVSREQLALFEEYASAFEALRAGVVGISPDGVWCHAAFAREVGLRFPLLSDTQPKDAVARAYGVYLEDGVASSRALFVVDGRGIVRWSRAYPGPVNPGVDGILRALESMGPTADAAPPQTGDRGKGVVRPWED
ncbi:MAG: Alkyl hydroperoxide reductase subunit C-like protein [uncultured Rubrobacteraceae bacterium]|uniref:Alkyl hydroperoxide reductase subunit C-like protein n=1 Tax=uncultured Rubrobacteraceae bacterium TaxID=349277 RepID=A0A6J4RZV8_9ACTN|nr:MAG: Alkyl hydroperoxide reductase subunit C-like protein [uncultured Rubrobacteraceae bacterium]